MHQRLFPSILVLLAAGAAGCGGPQTVDNGLWEITFQEFVIFKTEGSTIQPVERLPDRGPWRVEVVTDVKYSEREDKDVETVEVHMIEPFNPEKEEESRENLGPMAGWFEPSPRAGIQRFTVEGVDAVWHFRMAADVFSPQRLKGVVFGRHRQELDHIVEGRFELRKIPE